MGKLTAEEIGHVVRDRLSARGEMLNNWMAVEMAYRGDVVYPMATADQPNVPQLGPLLAAEIVDNNALRAGSVMPMVGIPALGTGEKGPKSRDYANRRQAAIRHCWNESKVNLQARRWFRHLGGYAAATLVVIPDHRREYPCIEARSPMVTLPEPRAVEDLSPILDCAFLTRRSGSYLRDRYPQVTAEIGGPITASHTEEMWDVVHWVDGEWEQLVLFGPVNSWGSHISTGSWLGQTGVPYRELSAWRNLTGRCPVVPTNKLALETIVSNVRNVLGQIEYANRLQAMAVLAQEKAIWPDIYARAAEGRNPSIVGGTWKDGRTGEINLLKDVDEVGSIRQTPDPQVQTMIDRLERNTRVSTGLVPQFGGETYGALRTGRGIDALAGIAVDPRIQEMQEQMEDALHQVNEIVLDCYKAYWGPNTYTLFSGQPTDRRVHEFTPSVHVETTANVVKYAIPGADAGQVTVILGQLLGMKTISRRTFMQRHPFIDDPDGELSTIDEEDLEEAVKQALVQGLVSQQIDPMFAAFVEQERKKPGADIISAVAAAYERMQKMQAAQPPPTPPGLGAPPEMMPGPTGGAPAGPMPGAQQQLQPTVQVTPDQQNMARLMQVLGQRAPRGA